MEEEDNSATQTLHDLGKMEHGCEHYRRRCKIRAPCCNEVFSCLHCHNEATNSFTNPKKDHELDHELVRGDVKQVICSLCDMEQEVARVCSNCHVTMGEYFCEICKLYDDDVTKEQFHCDECGICRVGGREKFFHCGKCGSCYSLDLRDNHLCVENSTKTHCPICYEYLFDSVKRTSILKCGHAIHVGCRVEMGAQQQYRCPICLKSMIDMSSTRELLDEEIADALMPEVYANLRF